MKKLSILTKTLTGMFLLATALTVTLPTTTPPNPIPPNSTEENGNIDDKEKEQIGNEQKDSEHSPCSDLDEPPILLQ